MFGIISSGQFTKRDMFEDRKSTKKYYELNPPKVGDKVVVLCTSRHIDMWLPDFTEIVAVTDRGRIVVEHHHDTYGKSFYKSGQNCFVPAGQCWLIPRALWTDQEMSEYWAYKEKEAREKKEMYARFADRSKQPKTPKTPPAPKKLSLSGAGKLTLGGSLDQEILRRKMRGQAND